MAAERLGYRANDAFNRRDLHAFLALMDPDIEFVPLADGKIIWWRDFSVAIDRAG